MKKIVGDENGSLLSEKEYAEAAKKRYGNSGDISPETIEAMKSGSDGAFTELYMHFFEPIFDFVNALVKNRAEAEEIVQDTFTYIWSKHETLSSDKNIKGFLYTIAKNNCMDFFRRKNVLGDYYALSEENGGTDISPDQFVIARETQLIIEMTISSMPPQRKRVFEMNRNENKTIQEISDALQISQSVVKKHMAAAKKNLRDVLTAALFLLL